MEVIHELSFDHDTRRTAARSEEIHLALGHGPSFKLEANTVPNGDDVVHGAVTITFCDTRTFGEYIMFSDAHVEEITEHNIERYFNGQGHRLVSVLGNQAFGNTIVKVTVYEEDDPPRRLLFPRIEGGFYPTHDTYWKRPWPMPTIEEIHRRLDEMGLMPSIEELALRQLERNYKIR